MIINSLDDCNYWVFAYKETDAETTHAMFRKEADPGLTYLKMAELFAKIGFERETSDGVNYSEL